MVSDTHRIIIDVGTESKEYTEKLNKEIDMLCGIVIEAFEENKVFLLSPYMRQLVLDKAKLVKELHEKVSNRIYIDAVNGKI